MDIATIIGFVLATIAVIGSIVYGGPLSIFIDIPSICCVGGGVTAGIFLKWPMETVKTLIPVYMKSIFITNADASKTIEEIGKLADVARRESVFALEKIQIDDPFIKKAMTLAADNRPPDVIAAILQLEIDALKGRHADGAALLDGIGADGPAFGMIGTLIGLVQMLQNMSDPSSIGPAMAVALLTTFYGSCIANIFAIPIKNKLKVRSGGEATKMTIVVAGTLGIVAGENPRLIKEKLISFLAPADRLKFIEEAKAEG